MAWAAFETTLAELLNAQRLGGNFRKRLDEAVEAAKLPSLDWGKGTWQAIGQLNGRRVDYVHRTATGTDLFPDVSAADEAFNTIRSALGDLCQMPGKTPPGWIADDSDRGWTGRAAISDSAYATVTYGGVDPNAPDTLRIVYSDARGEHVHAYHPPGADPNQLVTELLNNLNEPVSGIRVYRGNNLEVEWRLPMRGAP